MKINVLVPKRYSPPSSQRDGIQIHTLHQFTLSFIHSPMRMIRKHFRIKLSLIIIIQKELL